MTEYKDPKDPNVKSERQLEKEDFENYSKRISDRLISTAISNVVQDDERNLHKPNMLDMDELAANIKAQLQMDDINNVKSKGKGKADDEIDDAELARQLQEMELELDSDRLMAESIAHANETDGELLSGDFATEDREARGAAAALAEEINVAATQMDDSLIVESQIVDDEVLEKLAAKYGRCQGNHSLTARSLMESQEKPMTGEESSAWAASRPGSNLTTRGKEVAIVKRPCVACGDHIKYFDLARVPCDHEYCRPCLRELFRLSLVDESLFPPQCCRQPITLGKIRMHLSTDLAVSFYLKKLEMDTPNRTYCSNRKCLVFILPENIANDLATCPKCTAQTCTMCKTAVHSGDCPKDTALQQLLEVAEAQSWKRCYSCARIVELRTGCNHMACLCKAEFCYTCGNKWQTCECELWAEENLLDRANVLADRQVNPAPMVPFVPRVGARIVRHVPRVGRVAARIRAPAAVVAAAERRIRANHDCEHKSGWKYVREGNKCEECQQDMPDFIFECRQCELRVCKRCKDNRL